MTLIVTALFLCVKNNLSGIGKRNVYSELVLKIGFAGDFRGFYKE